MRRLLVLTTVLFLVQSTAACGRGKSEPEVAFTVPPSSTTTTTAPAKECSPPTVTTPSPDQKPNVTPPDGPAPTTLQQTDLVVGDGAEAKTGDTVKVEYVGVLYEGGKEFDASWNRGAEPFEFTLGSGQVIKGWDQGVVGMKVGGRRQLVIPADLAYGSQGQGDIPANATLVFVVDLLQVCTPETATTTVPGSSLPAVGGADSTASSTSPSTSPVDATGAASTTTETSSQ
ncbi:MAG: FKBP-type peptidyl-prolyl cis-trans isomerase [Acidimicrobiales bacterium]|nr:FKBP-type peptidyl-prolyl cis-trans isomerase [Acidimicrobiales bacterium]